VALSAYPPIAVNCSVLCTLTLEACGLTLIEVRAAVMLKVVEPLIEPEVAVMVVLPCITGVAMPELLMVAIVVAEELQVTEAVMSFVDPSL
jgi:hypothetical protein